MLFLKSFSFVSIYYVGYIRILISKILFMGMLTQTKAVSLQHEILKDTHKNGGRGVQREDSLFSKCLLCKAEVGVWLLLCTLASHVTAARCSFHLSLSFPIGDENKQIAHLCRVFYP